MISHRDSGRIWEASRAKTISPRWRSAVSPITRICSFPCPARYRLPKAVQLIKGGSAKWIHDTFRQHRNFAWQEGYGAFSIGIRQVDVTVAYIRKQAAHHKKQSFEAEFLKILKRHGIQYDPEYVLG
jgi:Transposase IS200 like